MNKRKPRSDAKQEPSPAASGPTKKTAPKTAPLSGSRLQLALASTALAVWLTLLALLAGFSAR